MYGKGKTILGLVVATGLFVMAGTASAEKRYVTDSAGNVVKDGFGGCVTAPVGGTLMSLPECGDAAPAKAEAPAKADAPAKAEAPAAKPAPLAVIDATAAEFAFDKSDLTSAHRTILIDVAGKLTGKENLEIVGHTDSKGSKAYNQKLSERRAKAVADFLRTFGVKNDMSVSGMGETQPVADNATDAGRAQNRRVEIRTK
jgi:outer membrane protein OmpA-like peptidoglycan-associated protein